MLPKRRKSKYHEEHPEIVAHLKYRNRIWESSNGRLTEIQDMDTNHIKNCIAKMKREQWKEEWIGILKMELTFRRVVSNTTLIKIDDANKRKPKRRRL